MAKSDKAINNLILSIYIQYVLQMKFIRI